MKLNCIDGPTVETGYGPSVRNDLLTLKMTGHKGTNMNRRSGREAYLALAAFGLLIVIIYLQPHLDAMIGGAR